MSVCGSIDVDRLILAAMVFGVDDLVRFQPQFPDGNPCGYGGLVDPAFRFEFGPPHDFPVVRCLC